MATNIQMNFKQCKYILNNIKISSLVWRLEQYTNCNDKYS